MTAVAILLCLHTATLTPQAKDTLLLDRKREPIREYPLNDFLSEKEEPRFDVPHTANYKGYTCCWEIRNSKLWLVDFNAKRDRKNVRPEDIFGQKLPIEAKWYSGRLTAFYEMPPFANSDLGRKFDSRHFIISGGVVEASRRTKARIGLPWGDNGFNVKRIDGKLTITDVNQKEPISKLLSEGETLVGLLDPNGVSVTFRGESPELVRAILQGDVGTEFIVIIEPADGDKQIRAVRVTRLDKHRDLNERLRKLAPTK